jgi:hypothetical protein
MIAATPAVPARARPEREVLHPKAFGLIHGHGVGRGRGLEPDPEEHHLPVRVLLAMVRHPGRVDHPDVTTLALDPEQILLAARHAQHVAERAEDHVGPGGDLDALSIISGVSRTPDSRAVDHLDLIGQQLVDAVADDRMRLPTTDFHDRPTPGGGRADLVDELSCQLGVAEFVQYFMTSPQLLHVARCGHPACFAAIANPSPNSSLSTPRCSNSASVRCRFLVEALDGEAHVHDDVLADGRVGDVLQADVLLNAAEIDERHQGAVTVLQTQDLPEPQHIGVLLSHTALPTNSD